MTYSAFSTNRTNRLYSLGASALLAATLLFTAGCGAGGGGYYEDDLVGGVDVSNVGAGLIDEFAITPAGYDDWDSDIFVPALAFDEVKFFGDYYEDFYDAEAYGYDVDFDYIVPFFDAFVEAFVDNEFAADIDDGYIV